MALSGWTAAPQEPESKGAETPFIARRAPDKVNSIQHAGHEVEVPLARFHYHIGILLSYTFRYPTIPYPTLR